MKSFYLLNGILKDHLPGDWEACGEVLSKCGLPYLLFCENIPKDSNRPDAPKCCWACGDKISRAYCRKNTVCHQNSSYTTFKGNIFKCGSIKLRRHFMTVFVELHVQRSLFAVARGSFKLLCLLCCFAHPAPLATTSSKVITRLRC